MTFRQAELTHADIVSALAYHAGDQPLFASTSARSRSEGVVGPATRRFGEADK